MIYLSLLETEEDKRYFKEIYENNYLKMYHVALGILHDKSEAENAVHEAFLSLAEKFQKYSHISGRKMDNFCVSIVKNKAIDSIRRSRHYTEEEIEDLKLYQDEKMVNPENILLSEETKGMIKKALEQISEVFRETLVLKFVYELSNAEIAYIQGVSKKTVVMRIYRGKQMLREVIREEDMQ